jgi:CHAT domain-containing protein/tetratricopeptide (TPR) repeat protein
LLIGVNVSLGAGRARNVVPTRSAALFCHSSQAGPPGAQSSPSDTAQKDSPRQFEIELWRAEILSGSGKLDEAEAMFRSAMAKATAAGDVQGQVRAHIGLGQVLYQKAYYPAARSECELALELLRSTSDARGEAMVVGMLGGIDYNTGDKAAAREHYRRSIDAYDRLGMRREKARMMLNLAMAADPDHDRLCQEALDLARQLGDGNLQAIALHFQGGELISAGEFDAAQEKLERAAELYQKAGDRSSVARVLTSEGVLQREHGHPEKSFELYQKALEIQQKIGDRQGAIQSVNAMAVAYDNLNEYSKSVDLYQRALAMARETGSPMLVDFELANLAGCYTNLGKDHEAAVILHDLLSHAADAQLMAFRYKSLSVALCNIGKYHESLAAAGKAVEGFRTLKATDSLPEALLTRARAEAMLGDQEAALADTDECLHTIEDLRKHLVPSDFMKRGFAEATQKTFAFSISLLVQSHQPARALEIAEQARSRAFLDLLATRDIKVSPARQEQIADLRKPGDELAARGIKPSNSQTDPTAGLVTRGGNPVSELWKQSVNGEAELRSMASAKPFAFAQLQGTAARLGSTVLSYWVGPDETLIWVVAPGGTVKSARVDVTSRRLADMVSALWPGGPRTKRRGDASPVESGDLSAPTSLTGELGEPVKTAEGIPAVTGRGGATITLAGDERRNWRELYRLLIQPVERWLPRAPGSLLTIEPHGPLLMLPFAALRNARGQYLIERFTLHYVPAVSLLAFTDGKKRATRLPPYYLLVADPSGIPRGDSGRPLPALAGARREASIVAGLVPSSEVKLLEGRDATERQVEELAGRSTVIHLATHGIIRDDQPFDSFLALGGSGWNLKQDGHFTAQKIYGLDLHADLVFLSACRSGLGQVKGDGMAALTRAFFYAGTPSVIATLWDVADEPTYRLVGAFYRAWLIGPKLNGAGLNGAGKARALRSAQLRLLSELRLGKVKLHTSAGTLALPEDPVFWASFVLQGEP